MDLLDLNLLDLNLLNLNQHQHEHVVVIVVDIPDLLLFLPDLYQRAFTMGSIGPN
jgi:hypothetical protein